jgi:hypothetical protein
MEDRMKRENLIPFLLFIPAMLMFISCENPASGDTNWREVGSAGQPAFQGSWKNYDSTNFATVAFRKDSLGFVHLKGLADGGTASSTMFYLPSGYMPGKTMFLVVYTGSGTCSVTIQLAGTVPEQCLVYIGTGFNTFISLDGVDFLAEK